MIYVITILACAILALAVALSRSRFNVQTQAQRIGELEKELERLSDECQEAKTSSAAKDIFVQNMSHEVRTPLNAVTGFAQLLSMPAEALTDEERAEYAEHVQHSSNMLMMLIDDILDVSDIKDGRYKIAPTVCQLKDICNAAISSVKYRLKDGISLTYKTDIPDDYTVYADPRRVQQVLINYLTNAMKHTDKGSITLTTSLDEHPGMLTFAVEDTGKGVPQEQAENIFTRFTKLDDFAKGTGIGLHICLTLAEKMNGKVFLDTKYAPGARFVFCLPLENKEVKE